MHLSIRIITQENLYHCFMHEYFLDHDPTVYFNHMIKDRAQAFLIYDKETLSMVTSVLKLRHICQGEICDQD